MKMSFWSIYRRYKSLRIKHASRSRSYFGELSDIPREHKLRISSVQQHFPPLYIKAASLCANLLLCDGSRVEQPEWIISYKRCNQIFLILQSKPDRGEAPNITDVRVFFIPRSK